MSDYDYLDQTPEKRGFPAGMGWDIASLIFVVGAMLLCLVFGVIFLNPYVSFNPLPPPTPIQPYQTPTPTITPIVLPPTWTPTPRPTFTPTNTPRPLDFVTETPSPAPTATETPAPVLPVTATPTLAAMPFEATVQALDAVIMHPESSCSWMGVGGEAYDLNNEPLIGLTVHVQGMLDGQPVDAYTVTGAAPQYGRAGFEIPLADRPIASTFSLSITLLDQAGVPLSNPVYFNTYDTCEKTLLLVRFKRVR